MTAREEFETWLSKWDAGHAVALPGFLDRIEAQAEERALRSAAEKVRGVRVSPDVRGGDVPALLASYIDPKGVQS